MSVTISCISLIIRRDSIETTLPGGWDQFLAEYGEPDECTVDEDLLWWGAMNGFDFELKVSHWKKRGLMLQSTRNGVKRWKDMVVTESTALDRPVFGLTIYDCEWLQLDDDLTVNFVGERKKPRRRRIRSEWPDDLVEFTMEVFLNLVRTPPKERTGVPLMNRDGRFGMLEVERESKKSLIVKDYSAYPPRRFKHFEHILNEGWVVNTDLLP